MEQKHVLGLSLLLAIGWSAAVSPAEEASRRGEHPSTASAAPTGDNDSSQESTGIRCGRGRSSSGRLSRAWDA